MSSAHRPEHGNAVPIGSATVLRVEPRLDARPIEPAPESALSARTAHLVPCARCGALNGRSALACWACEGDLLARGPLAAPISPPAPPTLVHAVVAPPVHPPISAVHDAAGTGAQRGLHLVSNTEAPEEVQPITGPALPDLSVELPVLSLQVEDTRPALFEPKKTRRAYSPPLVALGFAALLLLAIAAGLRWRAPAASASLPQATRATSVSAALERPFATPVPSNMADELTLSFAPLEVLPGSSSADRQERVAARGKNTEAARVSKKEREAIALAAQLRSAAAARALAAPAAACTSNMAALGLCTLEPAAAKE